MNSEQIMKPISVARNEFINNLTDLINNSMLPPFVIEDVLKDTYNKILLVAKQQLEEDTKRYNESVARAAKQAR